MKPPRIKSIPFAWGCNWSLWRGPGFELTLPESSNSKMNWKRELELLTDFKKMTKKQYQSKSAKFLHTHEVSK